MPSPCGCQAIQRAIPPGKVYAQEHLVENGSIECNKDCCSGDHCAGEGESKYNWHTSIAESKSRLER
jgi:hypothetical protein